MANKFCEELPIGDGDSTRSSVVDFLPYMFYSVNEAAKTYLEVDRRQAQAQPIRSKRGSIVLPYNKDERSIA